MELTLEHVTKTYKKFVALDDFSVTLTPGVYGLLGPNGAGKTTLIKTIVGAHHQDKGEIYFNGQPVDESFLDHLGFLPQAPLLYRNQTAEAFLRYMCVLKGVDRKDTAPIIQKLLAQVNLAGKKKRIGQFSGGMRQRLGIAQALIGDPDVLILDEPTAGLDPRERLRFRNLISELGYNKIVLLATHIVSDIEQIAKEIILLKQGKMLSISTPEQLIAEVSPYVWEVNDLTQDELASVSATHLVSNVRVHDQRGSLRLITQSKPHPHAVQAPADLEDVYLYFFREDAL